jgi:transposase
MPNNKQDRKVIKGLRFILLKRSDRLTATAKEKLNLLFSVNRKLALAYELKELLYELWNLKTAEEATLFLYKWCQMAISSGIASLKKYAKKLLAHQEAVINYFRFSMTNARLEEINNKIKTVQKQTYGLRNLDHLFLKIYSILLKKYALIG